MKADLPYQKYLDNELFFDMMQVISAPMAELSAFKDNVNKTLVNAIPGIKIVFYDFNSPDSDLYANCNATSLNMPETMWGHDWQVRYGRRPVIDPRKICREGKSAYTIPDVMSYEMYEKTPNYIEVIAPAGLYHSLNVFLRSGNRTIGQIGAMRPKGEEFSYQDIADVEMCVPYIKNRLLDYKNVELMKMCKEALFDAVSNGINGAILFDENMRLLCINPQAENICCDIYGDQFGEQYYVEQIARSVNFHYKCGDKKYMIKGKEQQYSIAVSSYAIGVDHGFKTVILALITSGKYMIDHIEIPQNIYMNSDFSDREKQVISLLALGMTNKQIGAELYLSEHTVRSHLQNIRYRLGVTNRVAILKELELLSK